MMDGAEFRRVMGHFPSGVTIVSTRLGNGRACGLTVNAFCSVSLQPPLILVCVERGAESHDCITAAGFFGVSVLESGSGEILSRRFATFDVEDKFEGVAFREEQTGAPILEDAVAWVDCRLTETYPGGDHTIFLGEVLAGGVGEASPLVYYRGGYGRFEP